jgi:UDP-N-acetylglucosamine--N-acetylmuramyl-(pentapeptide) pyrophosphoryl-undecaprenol N-acetylglucosamine transferase
MLIFSGGRTAGHIYPLIALIENLNKKCLFIGNNDSLEEKICNTNNIDFIGICKKNNKIINMLNGYNELIIKLKNYKIDAVVATGGFTSSSACLYAFMKNIPLYLIEENVILGDVNKLFSFYAKRVFLTYELPKMKKNFLVTGLPLRSIDKIKDVNINFDILVIGGSLGSRPLCDAAVIASKTHKVLLIAGKYKNEYKENNNLKIIEYTNDIYSYMKKAKIIISRSGASTTQEIMYINKPMIIIPSEKTKKNHQVLNANYLKDKKCALIIKEQNVKKDINRFIDLLMYDEKLRKNIENNQSKIINLNAKHLILSKIKDDLK